MRAYVAKKANPRWLWHAIDHHMGKVLGYVFGRRKDTVFLRLKALLEPFGITRYYTDGWGTHSSRTGRRCLIHPDPSMGYSGRLPFSQAHVTHSFLSVPSFKLA
jgi:IS1 family transposase